MAASEFVIDANLLVLLIVGSVRNDLIGRHRRLSNFRTRDYAVLVEVLAGSRKLWVTPNVLTEVSNLLGLDGSERSAPFAVALHNLIESSVEVYVRSDEASSRQEFARLGLTDAGLLEVASASRPLLTVDANLHLAAAAIDPDSAVNVRYLFDDRS